MASILVVGSANIDYTLTVQRLPAAGETIEAAGFDRKVGGKGVNQAVAAARAGGSVEMIACIGDDDHGQLIRTALGDEGIGIGHVFVTAGHSGAAVVTTAAGGDNMIAVVPAANAMLQPAMLDADQFAGKRVVLCQLEIPMAAVARAAGLARAEGATFILDPAPAKALSREVLAQVDWLTPNESEVRFLLGLPRGEIDPVAAAMRIRALGVGNVIVKFGARGSLLLCQSDDPVRIPAHEVAAVDTTAAGDSFNGAFAVALSEGARPNEAARFASAASALAVTQAGACCAMPHRPDIDRLIAAGPPPAAATR